MTRKPNETIAATQFKAHCLELMDRVEASGVSITITKHGRPVARLVPLEAYPASFFGSLPVTVVGDIVRPIGESWEAER